MSSNFYRPALACALLSLLSLPATATPVWSQGFETDTSGWEDSSTTWHGTATRVASGTGGIASSSGGFHAIFDQLGGASVTGPFSRFDMYRDTWPGPFLASIDVYLDTTWAAGSGFDFSVAASGTDNLHQRDFIFHVTQDTSSGQLLVGASNNTNFDPREDLETINHAVVASSGWYTFEHEFYDNMGVLAVDLVLRDAIGTELFRETRSDPTDTIPAEVGGNRYAWFTNIDITSGIAVDNHSLTIADVPEPASLALATFGLLAFRARRQR